MWANNLSAEYHDSVGNPSDESVVFGLGRIPCRGPRPLIMPHSAHNAISMGEVPPLKSDLAQEATLYGTVIVQNRVYNA